MIQARQDRVTPLVFAAALVAGASFWPASHLVGHDPFLPAWKGAGVALLALWAGLSARTPSGWLITVILAAGALGDVLLETTGQTIGAFAFLTGHLIAIILYRRHARVGKGSLAVGVMVLVMALSWWLTRSPLVLIYTAGLGGMVGSALTSRFPLSSVGLGAIMFAVSDLLIFAKQSVLAGSITPSLLIWPLYFAGQALIAFGVVTSLEQGKQ